jgi:hypothetical protein
VELSVVRGRDFQTPTHPGRNDDQWTAVDVTTARDGLMPFVNRGACPEGQKQRPERDRAIRYWAPERPIGTFRSSAK